MLLDIQNGLLYTLFKLTLFLLLLILLYDIVQKYVVPILWEQITLIEKAWKNLNQKKTLANSTKKHLHEEIECQKNTLDRLETKIKQWHHSLQEKKQITEQKKEQNYNALRIKKEEQANRFYLLKKQKLILPYSLQEAQKKLFHLRETPEGLTLLKKAINNIEKEGIKKKNYLEAKQCL